MRALVHRPIEIEKLQMLAQDPRSLQDKQNVLAQVCCYYTNLAYPGMLSLIANVLSMLFRATSVIMCARHNMLLRSARMLSLPAWHPQTC